MSSPEPTPGLTAPRAGAAVLMEGSTAHMFLSFLPSGWVSSKLALLYVGRFMAYLSWIHYLSDRTSSWAKVPAFCFDDVPVYLDIAGS